jgi:hypothetical protein
MGKRRKEAILEDPVQSWEQQDAESGVEYLVFTHYRDQGPERSLIRTATHMKRNRSLISRWARKFRWASRAKDYDRYCDKVRLDKQRKELEEMGERHARIAMLAQTRVLAALQSMKAEAMPPQAVVSMLDVAVRVERLARGVATQSTEVTGKGGAPLEIGEAHDRLKDLIRRAKLGRG